MLKAVGGALPALYVETNWGMPRIANTTPRSSNIAPQLFKAKS